MPMIEAKVTPETRFMSVILELLTGAGMEVISKKKGNIIESNESEKIVQRTVFSDSSDKKSLARTTLLATPSNGGHPRNAPNLRNP